MTQAPTRPDSRTLRTLDLAARRAPVVRAVGGPAELRAAAGVLDEARRRDGWLATARDVTLALPMLAVLLWRLARDRRVPLRVRAALVALVAYAVFPLDPIPDFLPVIGTLDDLLVAIVAVRWVLRTVDESIVREHWSGSPAALDALLALAR